MAKEKENHWTSITKTQTSKQFSTEQTILCGELSGNHSVARKRDTERLSDHNLSWPLRHTWQPREHKLATDRSTKRQKQSNTSTL